MNGEEKIGDKRKSYNKKRKMWKRLEEIFMQTLVYSLTFSWNLKFPKMSRKVKKAIYWTTGEWEKNGSPTSAPCPFFLNWPIVGTIWILLKKLREATFPWFQVFLTIRSHPFHRKNVALVEFEEVLLWSRIWV